MRGGRVWNAAPARITLANDKIHVWRAALDRSADQLRALERTLSADELGRAARFVFAQDRARFTAARGLLRILLGRYLQMEPAAVGFCYNRWGKPRLATAPGAGGLRFNASHCDGLALYAIVRGREIGIDLERIRADVAYEQVVASVFSPSEQAMFHALPVGRRLAAFFACWTRKEAYIKARGQGLALPLDQFDVSLAPGEPAALLNVQGDHQAPRLWSLHEIRPGPPYVGALAVEGDAGRIACWRLP